MLRIRYSLILLCSALALIPTLLFGVWAHNQAIESEFKEVRERNLLIAKNLSRALEQHHLDTIAVFESFAYNLANGSELQNVETTLANLDLGSIVVVEAATGRVVRCVAAEKTTPPEFIDQGMFELASSMASPDKTVLSPVTVDGNGTNVIYMVRAYGDTIAVGTLRTSYIVDIARSIAFGKQGHAVVVDQRGNVLAHPLPEWTVARKNISRVPAVQRMLKRETGIEQFYSPALEGDMIAGFTHVADAGWGVMVPQPISEVYANADESRRSAVVILGGGLFFALLLAAAFSIQLSRPIEALIRSYNEIRNTAERKPLTEPTGSFVPMEIAQLYRSYNSMVGNISKNQADIVRLAYSDQVTGLPSREAFAELAQAQLAQPPEPGQLGCAVLFIDLDDFKGVNDTMGHEIGDMVLKVQAGQIAAVIRERTGTDVLVSPIEEDGELVSALDGRSILSRVGGDEFMALVCGIADEQNLAELLEAINYRLSRAITIHDTQLSVGSSIGASLYGRDGTTLQDLTKKADIAMYWAKRAGKNCYRLFDSGQSNQTPSEIQAAVAQAIENDEMRLHYQPKVDAMTGEVHSVEALVRWISPHKGMIPPSQFIPVIDDTMIADQLGEWVLRNAAEQVRAWQGKGIDLPVSVNIASHHLVAEQFLPCVLDAIDRAGIGPQMIEIEITEETATNAHERALAVTRALKESGFAVSLDDYGRGYSNLTRLAALHVDTIKIDSTLTRMLGEDPRARIIVDSTIQMARGLNCAIVAEGVENATQAYILKDMGAELLQGYLFAKPMPPEDLEKWLTERAVSPTKLQIEHLARKVATA